MSKDKIKSAKELASVLEIRKQAGCKLVFTNGCFDIMHAGHVQYLEAAKALGDILVVAVNSDASVSRLKGPSRPVIAQQDRALMLAALACVDYVTIFDEDTPYETIRLLQPDILVKGGDWPVEEIVGGDIVLSKGGRVLSLPFKEGLSTSSIIAKIRESF